MIKNGSLPFFITALFVDAVEYEFDKALVISIKFSATIRTDSSFVKIRYNIDKSCMMNAACNQTQLGPSAHKSETDKKLASVG